jgi:hypothetical protein
MGELDAKAGTVTTDAPITDAALISTGSGEAGLWLWHGEAPPRPSLPQPKSRVECILARIMPAARLAAWMALPGGLALTLLALSVVPSAPPQRSEPTDKPAVILPLVPSPTTPRPIIAFPPAQLGDAQFDRVRAPSAPTAQILSREPERPVAQWRSQRKPLRIVRRTHAPRIRKGPTILITGVLTPPVMTWHGGGY